MPFRDRSDAGRQLADRLIELMPGPGDRQNLVVLALPRGGVPVACQIAQRLSAPLDVFLVRKLGVPFHEELAMGAIATGGVQVLNTELIQELAIDAQAVQAVAEREGRELERRDRAFRGDRPPLDVAGRAVVVVDDGLATGSTMEAAVRALRRLEPTEIIVAVPVGARESVDRVAALADKLVCLITPARFDAVGRWYEDFRQTTDGEVKMILDGDPLRCPKRAAGEPK